MNLQAHKEQSRFVAITQLKNYVRAHPDLSDPKLVSLLNHCNKFFQGITRSTSESELHHVCSQYSLHEYRIERPVIENVGAVSATFRKNLEEMYNLQSNPALQEMHKKLNDITGGSKLDEGRLIELIKSYLPHLVAANKIKFEEQNLSGGRNMTIARTAYYLIMVSPVALIAALFFQ